jgi:hypothetical protein
VSKRTLDSLRQHQLLHYHREGMRGSS